MTFARRLFSLLLPIAAIALLAAVYTLGETKITTSLAELVSCVGDGTSDGKMVANSRVFVIADSTDKAAANSEMKTLVKRLSAELAQYVVDVSFRDAKSADDDLADLIANRAGFASRTQVDKLKTPEGRSSIARAAKRRYYSPVPTIISPETDPFFLLTDYLVEMPPVAVIRLKDVTLDSIDNLVQFRERLSASFERYRPPPSVRFVACGSPLHTANSAAICKSEIGWLSLLSIVFIVFLAVFVFRGVKPLALIAGSLASAVAVGTAVLFMTHREIHLLSLVMGTSVMGIVVDYSFHCLLGTENTRAGVVRNLLISFITTELTFLPLMISSVPLLSQMAVFLAASLAAQLVYVLVSYPFARCEMNLQQSKIRILSRIVTIMALVVAVCGIFRIKFNTPIEALYDMPAELMAAERLLMPAGNRAENARNVDMLYEEHGGELAALLGFEKLSPPVVKESVKDRLLAKVKEWTSETKRLFLFSIALMIGALLVLYRMAVVKMALPSFLALMTVFGGFAHCGIDVNLFHLLAGFMLLGMSIDYTVFISSGKSIASSGCALLTSIVGFGSLAFVSFPVVRHFGVVIALGLPVAFLSAICIAGPKKSADEGVECAASVLGLRLIGIVYRLLGLRALHAVAFMVGASIWSFSPTARRRSGCAARFFSFIRSLADKFAVMSGAGRLPRIRLGDDFETREFIERVNAKRGAFVISSHCGTIETLAALGSPEVTFHAWMDIGRTSVFNSFYLSNLARRRIQIHSISDMNIGTGIFAGEAIERGDCIVMAGDRGDGVFRFAAALGVQAYFVAANYDAGAYSFTVKRLCGDANAMKTQFDGALETLKAKYPEQIYEWKI